jgi:hypothetical protein
MNQFSNALELPKSVHLVKNFPKERAVELILSAPMFHDMEPADAAVLARFLSLYEVDSGAVVFSGR